MNNKPKYKQFEWLPIQVKLNKEWKKRDAEKVISTLDWAKPWT